MQNFSPIGRVVFEIWPLKFCDFGALKKGQKVSKAISQKTLDRFG
jgi:hypothetical protein